MKNSYNSNINQVSGTRTTFSEAQVQVQEIKCLYLQTCSWTPKYYYGSIYLRVGIVE